MEGGKVPRQTSDQGCKVKIVSIGEGNHIQHVLMRKKEWSGSRYEKIGKDVMRW